MQKKVPKVFLGYSVALIMVGIIAVRYYYTSSVRSFAVLGISLLILGILSLIATSIYALHAKGEARLKRLVIVSASSLFTGLGLLHINYYINSHSFDNHWNKYLEIAGGGLFLLGIGFLVVAVISVMVKSKTKNNTDN